MHPWLRSWTPFLLLVVIPAIGFFLYSFREIDQAGRRIADAERTITSSPNETTLERSLDDLREMLRQASREVTAKDDEIKRQDTILASAEIVLRELRRATSVLAASGVTEGTLSERISAIASDVNTDECSECLRQLSAAQKELEGLRTQRALRKVGPYTYHVFFGFDNDDVTPTISNALDVIATTMVGEGYRHVSLIGFTDRVGSKTTNCIIAGQRTASVASVLSKFDLTVHEVPRGELGVPVMPDVDELEEPLNRIAEVRFRRSPPELPGRCKQYLPEPAER